MKILKPGKVEQRKFVCPKCGCIFVASRADLEQDSYGTWAICPQEGCSYNFTVRPETGEPWYGNGNSGYVSSQRRDF